MRAFIDFEASSLGRHGYPIEVAWVFEDGRSASFLIAPIDGWTDWNPAAEEIHGISRAQLAREGVAAPLVARHLVDELAGHQVLASAPSWDARWMSRLLRAGGLPRHAIRVTDTDAALLELATALLAPALSSSQVHRASRQIMASAGDRFAGRRRAHRALADAELERDRWLTVCRLARAYAGLPADGRVARPPAAPREANLLLHPRAYPQTSLDRPGAEWRAS
ncbi:3'-5' exonuclease [Sphingomonas sp. PR090111-T3T-6A]|uniref:3'-5' exonuclease n=1 Tax=Sphingomonas sp. PR090111-T3T-6A TaxID=685778 RepID=UPI0003A1BA8B|nr:transcriptional regulator [Sphingomonas sp. PR090111-T3T-6A]